MIRYHLAGFVFGCALDLIVGDPHSIPHPVVLIGKLIGLFDRNFQKRREMLSRGEKRLCGLVMVLVVTSLTFFAAGAILLITYRIHPFFGCAAETVMTCQILAARSLHDESMKVYDRLAHGTLVQARRAVSMIVGRDTQALDEDHVIKAAVETVAENTSDGVIAPMLFTALGGPAIGFAYKAVNTMDSMVGYRNERYEDFGRAAARLDDFVNFIPSRISALLMILACVFCGSKFHAGDAMRIWKRDRRKHASPNSAQTESVMAGALGLQLAGDASYFGKIVHKPYIGDPVREAVPQDIPRANRLMFVTAFLCFALCTGILFLSAR